MFCVHCNLKKFLISPNAIIITKTINTKARLHSGPFQTGTDRPSLYTRTPLSDQVGVCYLYQGTDKKCVPSGLILCEHMD